MSNGWYDNGHHKAMLKAYDLSADQVALYLIRTSGGQTGPYYTPDLVNHTNLTDVPDNVDCRAASMDVATGTWVASLFDCANAVFSALPAGEEIQGLLWVHKATGDLLAWMDTLQGLPFTPADVDVTVNTPVGVFDIVSA